jgi:hypothetical protein
MRPMPTADALEVVVPWLVRYGAAAFLAFLAYSLARHVASEDGVRARHIIGALIAAFVIAAVEADRLGTIRESDGDPFYPTYDVSNAPHRLPPTSEDRRWRGITVFLLITLPAAFGLYRGSVAHRSTVTRIPPANT